MLLVGEPLVFAQGASNANEWTFAVDLDGTLLENAGGQPNLKEANHLIQTEYGNFKLYPNARVFLHWLSQRGEIVINSVGNHDRNVQIVHQIFQPKKANPSSSYHSGPDGETMSFDSEHVSATQRFPKYWQTRIKSDFGESVRIITPTAGFGEYMQKDLRYLNNQLQNILLIDDDLPHNSALRKENSGEQFLLHQQRRNHVAMPRERLSGPTNGRRLAIYTGVLDEIFRRAHATGDSLRKVHYEILKNQGQDFYLDPKYQSRGEEILKNHAHEMRVQEQANQVFRCFTAEFAR